MHVIRTKKTLAVALSAISFLVTPCFASPVSYGSPEQMEDYQQSEKPAEGQDDLLQEDGEIAQDETADSRSSYSRTEVIEKVAYYFDNKVVRHRDLKKVVRGQRTEVEGKKGWRVAIAEEYVKYWHTTQHQKTPVIGVRRGQAFYPDNEDGTPVDLDSL